DSPAHPWRCFRGPAEAVSGSDCTSAGCSAIASGHVSFKQFFRFRWSHKEPALPMKTNIPRRRLLQLPCAAILPRLLSAAAPISDRRYEFRRDHILGTSFDMVVEAPSPARAQEAEANVLAEIARLSGVLSTYDKAGEASRLDRSDGAVSVSPELFSVLHAYELWRRRTGGALTCGAGFDLDPAGGTACRAGGGDLNLDALGKAWILESALRAGRRSASAVMLDIGGDIAIDSGNGESAEIDIA